MLRNVGQTFLSALLPCAFAALRLCVSPVLSPPSPSSLLIRLLPFSVSIRVFRGQHSLSLVAAKGRAKPFVANP
jgi:hypothetical protein